ncbi:MAG: hypothetical protein CVU89_17480 [Firmicutes bacterium HGW-Firmicutes-14]|nr:MAG: hypothetical protein CVU89_17480 [Firmicutes bacterium HGW-Firmicutes-14]
MTKDAMDNRLKFLIKTRKLLALLVVLIIIGAGILVYNRFFAYADPQALWNPQFDNSGVAVKVMAQADIDGDGNVEIAFVDNNRNFKVLRSDGTQITNGTGTFIMSSAPYNMAVGDISGNGNADFIVPNGNTNPPFRVYKYNSSTGKIDEHSMVLSSSRGNVNLAVYGDFTNDGVEDIIVAQSGNRNIAVYKKDGTESFDWDHGQNILNIAYAKNTGTNYALAATCSDSKIYFWRNDNNNTSDKNVGISNNTHYSIAAADFNGDGVEDFACASRVVNNNNWLYIINGTDGTIMSGVVNTGNLGPVYDLKLVDVTGDGVKDIILGTGDAKNAGYDNRVHVHDGTNTTTNGTSTTYMSSGFASPVYAVEVGEFDGDTTTGDIFAGYGSTLKILNFSGGFTDPNISQTTSGGAIQLSGLGNIGAIVCGRVNSQDNVDDIVVGTAQKVEAYTFDSTPPVIGLNPLPTDISDVSGPTYGPSTTFNISLDESAYITINIYDSAEKTNLVAAVANQYRVDKSDSSWTYAPTWDGSGNTGSGTYYYDITAIDNEVNSVPGSTATNTSSYSGTLELDMTAPTGEITAPSENEAVNGTVTITGTAKDELASHFMNYSVHYEAYNSGSWKSIGTNPRTTPADNGTLATWDTSSLNDGTYRIRLTVNDRYGHTTTAYRVVKVDKTGPEISLNYYKNYEGGSGTFSDDLPISDGLPITNRQNVYIKIVANEALQADPTVNITGTANNNVSGGAASAVPGHSNTYVYTWNVANSETGTVTASVGIVGQDLADNNVSYTENDDIKVDTNILTPALTADDQWDKVSLTWTNSESDHTEYRIWRSATSPVDTAGAPDFTAVGPLSSWDDTTATVNQLYYYRIKSVDLAGNISSESNEVSGTALPSPPTLTVNYYADEDLTQELPRDGSNIYHTRAQNVYIKVTSNKDLSSPPTYGIQAPSAGNSLSGPQSMTAVSGATVFKGAAAWNVISESGGEGDALIKFTGSTAEGYDFTDLNPAGASGGKIKINTVIETPSLLYTIEGEQLTLRWSAEADHEEYYIYRSLTDGFTPDEGSLFATVNAPAEQYSTLMLEDIYYYRIKARDVAGNISAASPQQRVYRELTNTTAYVRYFNNSPYVAVSVYWNDTGDGANVQWADDVVPSGDKLDWKSEGLTVTGLETKAACATLTGAVPYRNYYFRLVKGGKITIVRAFPAEFNPESGPRYQNDYAHGNFSPGTAMCAACHVTHSALKAQLLKQATYYDLCLFCHGTASTQSKYDVQSGKVRTADGWKDSLAGPIGSDYGISRHNVDDRSSVDTAVYGSAPGKILTFTCVSCHKSHGGTNDNYRLIREIIYPSNDKFTSTTVYYNAYAIVKDPTVGEEVYMVSGNTEFCTACHLDYDDGSALYQGGTYSAYYRHPVTVGNQVYSVYRSDPLRNWYPGSGDNLPLQVYGAGESIGSDKRTAVVCSTCHYAHGTYREFNMGYPRANGLPRESISNQKMLRMNNYAVCESCHKK